MLGNKTEGALLCMADAYDVDYDAVGTRIHSGI